MLCHIIQRIHALMECHRIWCCIRKGIVQIYRNSMNLICHVRTEISIVFPVRTNKSASMDIDKQRAVFSPVLCPQNIHAIGKAIHGAANAFYLFTKIGICHNFFRVQRFAGLCRSPVCISYDFENFLFSLLCHLTLPPCTLLFSDTV